MLLILAVEAGEAAFKKLTPAMLLARYQEFLVAATAALRIALDVEPRAFNPSISGSVNRFEPRTNFLLTREVREELQQHL